jgi:DNA-binding transcriptional MerR regulator
MLTENERDGKLLRIGDFARRAETNLRTLRYYEEIGLLVPAERSRGGFRFYRETDLHRLNMVRALQGLGLPLEGIKVLMATRETALERGEFIARVKLALEEQDRLLTEKLRVVERERDHIRLARAKLEECADCTHRPTAANNFCEPCQVDGKPLPADLSALF